jgi:hypothetical protein
MKEKGKTKFQKFFMSSLQTCFILATTTLSITTAVK